MLDQLDFSFEDIKNGKKVIPKYHALYLNSLSSVEKNEEFKKYIEEIKNIEPVIPSEVSDILRGYQKDGMHGSASFLILASAVYWRTIWVLVKRCRLLRIFTE